MTKEKQIQECERKRLIDELSKMPPMVIATAYLHALNYTLYGVDVTEKWLTATQNASALERAYHKGYCDALEQRWIPVSEQLPKTRDEVLIFLANGQITIASYNDHILPFFNKPIGWGVDAKRFVFDFCSDDVIAWMPLPQVLHLKEDEE